MAALVGNIGFINAGIRKQPEPRLGIVADACRYSILKPPIKYCKQQPSEGGV